ncbi:hypothetical protein ACFFKB_00955 [Mameliella alba]|uniref:hypothetical protein n=1 Tax=Mameliella alba TaxID=561184 RepID=UPI001054C12F|nr:hypothetical protein [Mameliella alba]
MKTYRMYQSGERAGFPEAEADALIRQGFAVDPEMATALQETADAQAADAAQLRREAVADAIEQVGEGDYTKSGKPDVDAINRLMPEGAAPVSADERDAVWTELQAG